MVGQLDPEVLQLWDLAGLENPAIQIFDLVRVSPREELLRRSADRVRSTELEHLPQAGIEIDVAAVAAFDRDPDRRALDDGAQELVTALQRRLGLRLFGDVEDNGHHVLDFVLFVQKRQLGHEEVPLDTVRNDAVLEEWDRLFGLQDAFLFQADGTRGVLVQELPVMAADHVLRLAAAKIAEGLIHHQDPAVPVLHGYADGDIAEDRLKELLALAQGSKGFDLARDMLGRAAISEKGSALVEQRLAVDAGITGRPVHSLVAELEILDRLVGFQNGAVGLPDRIVGVHAWHLPARPAAQVFFAKSRLRLAAAIEGEPELVVQLPQPVRGAFGEIPETRLASAQRRFGLLEPRDLLNDPGLSDRPVADAGNRLALFAHVHPALLAGADTVLEVDRRGFRIGFHDLGTVVGVDVGQEVLVAAAFLRHRFAQEITVGAEGMASIALGIPLPADHLGITMGIGGQVFIVLRFSQGLVAGRLGLGEPRLEGLDLFEQLFLRLLRIDDAP